MSYVYAWFGEDEDLFYIGFSSGSSKVASRAKRMVGVTYTNRQLSRAEQYYYKRNREQKSTTIKIIKDGLSDHEGLLLESSLIIKYKSILLNSAHLKLNMINTKKMDVDIFSLSESLLKKIRNGKIKHSEKIVIWQKPRLLYIDYYDGRYDIISPKTFIFQFGVTVSDFLKYHTPQYYKIKEIGIEYEDSVLYYDKFTY